MFDLILDTSTDKSFCILVKDEKIIFKADIPKGLNSSKVLLSELDKGFKKAGILPKDLRYIAVGIGPGSYTGIRVGAIVAKTLSYAVKVPLITFSSLLPYLKEEGTASVIDARIGGIYVQKNPYTDPVIIQLENLKNYLEGFKRLVSPNISSLETKLKDLHFLLEEIDPDEAFIQQKVSKLYVEGQFTDLEKIELLYLRKTQAELELEKKQLIDN